MNDELKEKTVAFIEAFECVFRDDWDHGQTVLGVDHWAKRDFLRPEAYSDWGNQEALVSAYFDLREQLRKPEAGSPSSVSDGTAADGPPAAR